MIQPLPAGTSSGARLLSSSRSATTRIWTIPTRRSALITSQPALPSTLIVCSLSLLDVTVPLQTFQQAGYTVFFLPALEFVFINQPTLLDRISQPQNYSALVATSPRGAAAAITALTTLASSSPNLLSAWKSKPFYVVGDGSAGIIARSTLSLSVRAVGGNAERLGAAIVSDLSQSTQPSTRLLVLSGNLRREELFTTLTRAAVQYDELTVYETRTNSRLYSEWQQLADRTEADGWVCYFSPSGVSGVRRCVEQAASEGEVGEERRVRWLGLRVAALGQTSARAVREAGWTVHAVAESPSPTQLLAAI